MNIDEVLESDILKSIDIFNDHSIKCDCIKSSIKCYKCSGKKYIIPCQDMKLSIIAAVGENGAIGANNRLLWNIPADMKFFKETTNNSTVIMGRKTFDSIGKPLKNRTNIVITRCNTPIPDVIICDSVQNAIKQCDVRKESFIIGGSEIYGQFLPFVNKMYLTIVHDCPIADKFFPNFDKQKWKLDNTRSDVSNDIAINFNTYVRNK